MRQGVLNIMSPLVACVYRFDDRERSLLDTFRRCTEGRSGVRIENERLAMGDIIIEADPNTEGGPMVTVERKKLHGSGSIRIRRETRRATSPVGGLSKRRGSVGQCLRMDRGLGGG